MAGPEPSPPGPGGAAAARAQPAAPAAAAAKAVSAAAGKQAGQLLVSCDGAPPAPADGSAWRIAAGPRAPGAPGGADAASDAAGADGGCDAAGTDEGAYADDELGASASFTSAAAALALALAPPPAAGAAPPPPGSAGDCGAGGSASGASSCAQSPPLSTAASLASAHAAGHAGSAGGPAAAGADHAPGAAAAAAAGAPVPAAGHGARGESPVSTADAGSGPEGASPRPHRHHHHHRHSRTDGESPSQSLRSPHGYYDGSDGGHANFGSHRHHQHQHHNGGRQQVHGNGGGGSGGGGLAAAARQHRGGGGHPQAAAPQHGAGANGLNRPHSSPMLGPRPLAPAPSAHPGARPRQQQPGQRAVTFFAGGGGGAGTAGGVVASGGSFSMLGPGPSGASFANLGAANLGEKRRLAELVPVSEIAKGFSASRWWQRGVLDVFRGGRPCGSSAALLRHVPAHAGLYVWLVRPPGTRAWVAVYLGSADDLRERMGTYLHDDGSFGPASDPRRLRAMVDMQRRSFSIQVRYRAVKAGCCCAADDAAAKLRLFSFPLNVADGGKHGYREIELPSARPVCEHPLANAAMARVFEQLVQRA